MAGRGRNQRIRGEYANVNTPAGQKAIKRAVSLILEASPTADAEMARCNMLYLAQAYNQGLGTSWAQQPGDAQKKLGNVETQADALYRALHNMGGLAVAYYANLVDQELAALHSDMETIKKIKARAGSLSEFLKKFLVKKGQVTPGLFLLEKCCEVLDLMNIPIGSLPPKIARAIHEAVTLQEEKDAPQQFDAAWDKYSQAIKTPKRTDNPDESSEPSYEVY